MSISLINNLKPDFYKTRYIVPFYFKDSTKLNMPNNSKGSSEELDDFSIYREAYSSLQESGSWYISSYKSEEQDLYDYIIRTLYANANGSLDYSKTSNRSLGSVWSYDSLYEKIVKWLRRISTPELFKSDNKDHKDNKDRNALKDNKDCISESNGTIATKYRELNIVLKNISLYIFKNGIGFFSYDVETDFDSADDLIIFQSTFKELAFLRSFNPFFDESTPKELYCDNSKQFVTGAWIDDFIYNLFGQVHYYPDRVRPDVLSNIDIANVSKVTESSNASNMTNSKNASFNDVNSNSRKIPDKAILFNYFVFNEQNLENGIVTNEKLSELAYMLTNGFNHSYDKASNCADMMYRPFNNIVWFTNSHGCGQYLTYSKKNERFFKNFMLNRMFNDYFLLYIILLYQHYSLLNFSEKISCDISNDINKEDIDYIQNIAEEINLFLVKCIYSSVSHIEQHNLVYKYFSRSLSIKENISGITIGLDSLNQLLRNKAMDKDAERENKIQNLLSIMSFMIITSALTDCFSVFDNDIPTLNEKLGWNLGFIDSELYQYIKISFILILLIVFLFVFFGKITIKKKYKRKQEK